MLIGTHSSVKDTPLGNVVQIFLRSPLRLEQTMVDYSPLKFYQGQIFVHAGYLYNFCNDPKIYKWACDLLIQEFEACTELDAVGMVLHMGSTTKNLTSDEAYSNFIKNVEYILEQTKHCKTKLVFETPHTIGNKVASTIEEFATLIKNIDSKYRYRISTCIDTCHVFIHGYPINTPEGMTEYLKNYDKHIGIEKLALIHLNDSLLPFGSKLDRHGTVGKGYIFGNTKGREALDILLHYAKKYEIPLILESRTRDKDYSHELEFIESQKGGNHKVAGILRKMGEIEKVLGKPFESTAYINAADAVEEAEDLKDVKHLVGKRIAEKISYILDHGELKELIEYQKDPRIRALLTLQSVMGIGPATANELYSKGIKTISDLKKNKHLLNHVQQIGLQYHDELKNRIPRSEMEEIYQKIQEILGDEYHVIPAGSYALGKPDSGDIDIILTHSGVKTREDLSNINLQLANALLKNGILKEILAKGESRLHGIIDYNGAKLIDIRIAPLELVPYFELYFSVGSEVARELRQKAKNKGYTLSEWGLKTPEGNRIFHSKKDIVDFLM